MNVKREEVKSFEPRENGELLLRKGHWPSVWDKMLLEAKCQTIGRQRFIFATEVWTGILIKMLHRIIPGEWGDLNAICKSVNQTLLDTRNRFLPDVY